MIKRGRKEITVVKSYSYIKNVQIIYIITVIKTDFKQCFQMYLILQGKPIFKSLALSLFLIVYWKSDIGSRSGADIGSDHALVMLTFQFSSEDGEKAKPAKTKV